MLRNAGIHIAVGMIAVLCVLGNGCRGSGGPDTTEDNETSDTTAVRDTSDTTPDADSTTGRTDEDRPAPPPPAPAPGTAEVRATVLSCDTAHATTRCQIRIEEVLAYGSTTPPLNTGEREVSVYPSILKDRSVQALPSNEPRTLVLNYSSQRSIQTDRANEEDGLEWGIQSIKAP